MLSNTQHIWLNGQILSTSRACLSPLDLGFTIGDGAFETLRAYGGRPFAVTRHWNRLTESCRVLGIESPSKKDFTIALQSTLEANQFSEARVRFTISRGPGTIATSNTETVPTVLVTASAAPHYDGPEKVATTPWPRNERSPLCRVKTISYLENALALRHARNVGAGEAIFANSRNDLCEGATSNVFLVKGDRIITPPIFSGCLPGVTRGLVLESAREDGLPIEEAEVPLSTLHESSEAFLTSSTREVQAISTVDGIPLSQPAGPISRRLAELIKELIHRNLDP